MNLPCPPMAADAHTRATTASRTPEEATPTGRLLAELRVPAVGRLAADIRAFVRDHLRHLGAADRLLDDGVLLATELFTNAVRHAPGARIAVRFLHDPRARTCTVLVDDASRLPPQPGDRSVALRESGMGLAVVAELSHAWGWHASADGKTVWFSLRLHHPRHPGLEGATPCAKTSHSTATAPPCGAGSTSPKAPLSPRQSS